MTEEKQFVILEIRPTSEFKDAEGLQRFTPVDQPTAEYMWLKPERSIPESRLVLSVLPGWALLKIIHADRGDCQPMYLKVHDPPEPETEKKANLIGKRVTVYDRHLFAVPVRGTVTDVSEYDGAYQVEFDSGQPGFHNVTKHSKKYFFIEQCRIDSAPMSPPEPEVKDSRIGWIDSFPDFKEFEDLNLWKIAVVEWFKQIPK